MSFDLIERKVWKYIRRKKFFVFSDVLIVTGIKQDFLNNILQSYESKGYIKIDVKSTKSNRIYTVPKKLDLNSNFSLEEIQNASKSIKPFVKVVTKLNGIEDTEISFLSLLKLTNISKGTLKIIVNQLLATDILKVKNQSRLNSIYELNLINLNYMNSYCLNKEYSEIRLILEGKKQLTKKHELPNDLLQILKTITENEALKRDELAKLAGVTRKRITDWWQILKKLGLIIDSYKENTIERVTYIFSAKRAKIVLKHLNDGAYEKDKELKHLWIKQ